MIVLLLKITLLFTFALAAVAILFRATAATRHLFCATAFFGSLLLPLTLLIAAPAFSIRVHALQAGAGPALPSGAPFPVSRLFWALWAVGFAFLFIRLLIGYWRISRLPRTFIGDNLFEADVPVPLVYGLFRPAILLPLSSAAWSSEQRDAAVRHERAHIQRRDLWTRLASQLACALYWFHPFVWLTAHVMRREQELACDDAVIDSGMRPDIYAAALITAARSALQRNPPIGCPMLTTNTLRPRIERVLDASLTRKPSTAGLLRAAIMGATAFCCIAMIHPVKADDQRTAPRVIQKFEPPYTDEAKEAGIQGTVLLSVRIGDDGAATDIRVLRSLDAGLDAEAVNAVRHWQFQPATLNGKPVSTRAQIAVEFRLM